MVTKNICRHPQGAFDQTTERRSDKYVAVTMILIVTDLHTEAYVKIDVALHVKNPQR